MRNIKKFVALLICFCMFNSFTGFASDLTWENTPGNHDESTLLVNGELSASDEYRTVARGDFLSAGALDISNPEDGTIYIAIDTFAHFGVDRIFHTVFLDQWDAEEQDWIQVNHWNFVKSKEEEEDGTLNALYTSFTVSGYEVDKYYRVRGLHGAEYNDEVEACATETDGVLITDGPT